MRILAKATGKPGLLVGTGTLAERPAARVFGIGIYFTTDSNGAIWVSDGTTWAQWAPGTLSVGPGSSNGYRAEAYIVPSGSDNEIIGLVFKIPNATSGVGQDYSEGNQIVLLSDASASGYTPPASTPPIKKTITATTNATPVKVTTAAHGFSTGDIVRITGTGITALDNLWWKVTVTSSTQFTLDTSTAPGSTSATGEAFTDRSPVLARLDGDGWGFLAAHIAAGLRGRSGAALPGVAAWVQLAADMVGLVIDNPSTDVWGPTPTKAFAAFVDSRSTPARTIWQVEADGTMTVRPESTRGATDVLFRVRDDGDTTDNFRVLANGSVLANVGQAAQVGVGDIGGLATVLLGGTGTPVEVYRPSSGVLALAATHISVVADWGVWTGVTYQNSWADVAGIQGVRYRKVGDDVQIEGGCSGGTDGTVAFTLPAGFRPAAATTYVSILSLGGTGYATITSTGTVSLTKLTGAVTDFFLGRITFSVL